MASDIRFGLNPYGLTYTLGLEGIGTARANPSPFDLWQYLDLAAEIGSRAVEVHGPHLLELDDDGLRRFRIHIQERQWTPVLSWGPPAAKFVDGVYLARKFGIDRVRLGLSSVLRGARAELGSEWDALVDDVRFHLRQAAREARREGLELAIENHQDFGSEELIALAQEAGENVGITLDTGNPLAVGEPILEFVRKTAPLVRHVHLKDYRVKFSHDGFVLVRCTAGTGCVPFGEIHDVLSAEGSSVTACMEHAALHSRHIRLLASDWWQGYRMRSALDVAACFESALPNRLPESDDAKTPWERGAGHEEMLHYERTMMVQGAAALRRLGWGG